MQALRGGIRDATALMPKEPALYGPGMMSRVALSLSGVSHQRILAWLVAYFPVTKAMLATCKVGREVHQLYTN